jgi:hypothetical protein
MTSLTHCPHCRSPLGNNDGACRSYPVHFKNKKISALFYHQLQICIIEEMFSLDGGINSLRREIFRLSFLPNWTPQNIQQKISNYIVFS